MDRLYLSSRGPLFLKSHGGGRNGESGVNAFLIRCQNAIRSWLPLVQSYHRFRLPAPLGRLLTGTAVLLVIGYALFTRFMVYLENHSLWLDESFLAVGVLTTPVSRLFEPPLPYSQSAPTGYLLLVKLIIRMLGDSELALRLPSLIAGLAAPLLTGIAAGLVGRSVMWGCVGAALLLMSPEMLRYAAEFKQYAVETAVSAFLICASVVVVRNPSARTISLLATIAAVTPWFSLPAGLFIAPVCGIVLVWALRKVRLPFKLSLGLLSAMTVSYAIYVMLLLAGRLISFEQQRLFLDYFKHDFLVWPTQISEVGPLVGKMVGVFGVLGPAPIIIVAALFIAGIAALAARHWPLAAVCGLPWFLLVLAAFGRYPLVPRLILFIAPLLAVGVSVGLAAIQQRRFGWLLVIPCLALVTAGPFAATLARVLEPYSFHEMRPALEVLARHRSPDDVIYVTVNAEPTFNYYARRLRIPVSQTIIAKRELDAEQVASILSQNRRTWIVWSWAPLHEQEWLDRLVTEQQERFLVSRTPYPLVMRYLLVPKGQPVDDELRRLGGWLPESAAIVDPERERLRLHHEIASTLDRGRQARAALALADLEERSGDRVAMRSALTRAVEAEGSGTLAFEAARRLAKDSAATGNLAEVLTWYREAARRMPPWAGVAYAEAASAARAAARWDIAAQFAEDAVVAYRTQLNDPNVPGLLAQVVELLVAAYAAQGKETAARWAAQLANHTGHAETGFPTDLGPALRLTPVHATTGSGPRGDYRLGPGDALRYESVVTTEGVVRIDTRAEANASTLRVVIRRAVRGEVVRDVRLTSSTAGETTLLSVPADEPLHIAITVEARAGAEGRVSVLGVAVA